MRKGLAKGKKRTKEEGGRKDEGNRKEKEGRKERVRTGEGKGWEDMESRMGGYGRKNTERRIIENEDME